MTKAKDKSSIVKVTEKSLSLIKTKGFKFNNNGIVYKRLYQNESKKY